LYVLSGSHNPGRYPGVGWTGCTNKLRHTFRGPQKEEVGAGKKRQSPATIEPRVAQAEIAEKGRWGNVGSRNYSPINKRSTRRKEGGKPFQLKEKDRTEGGWRLELQKVNNREIKGKKKKKTTIAMVARGEKKRNRRRVNRGLRFFGGTRKKLGTKKKAGSNPVAWPFRDLERGRCQNGKKNGTELTGEGT